MRVCNQCEDIMNQVYGLSVHPVILYFWMCALPHQHSCQYLGENGWTLSGLCIPYRFWHVRAHSFCCKHSHFQRSACRLVRRKPFAKLFAHHPPLVPEVCQAESGELTFGPSVTASHSSDTDALATLRYTYATQLLDSSESYQSFVLPRATIDFAHDEMKQ